MLSLVSFTAIADILVLLVSVTYRQHDQQLAKVSSPASSIDRTMPPRKRSLNPTSVRFLRNSTRIWH
jgi:hypothetical protein